MTNDVPPWERWVITLAYPLIAATMRRSLPATPDVRNGSRREIEGVLDEVDACLSDGRPYLVGGRLSIADIAFASLVAPVVGPARYGVPLPTDDDLPEGLRTFVHELRARPAGQFALRLYQEHRTPRVPVSAPTHHPASTSPVGPIGYLRGRVAARLTGHTVQRWLFALLRRWKPVLVFGQTVVVTRDADVRDVLSRDEEFTIAEINGTNMERLSGPFILGMDRSERYTREQAMLRAAARVDDSERVHRMARVHAARLVDAARPIGRIDMVSNLARPVAARIIAGYFGVSGPSETELMRWMRAVFHELFLNLSQESSVRRTAEQAAADLRGYLMDLIGERKVAIRAGDDRDDVLSRLIRMQIAGEVDVKDDDIRRNISGLIIGALDTTSKASTLAMDQLLRRPDILRTAHAHADDVDLIRQFAFEALRFNTMAPVIVRFSRGRATIGERGVRVPARAKVFAASASAMFDWRAWPSPRDFLTDRPVGAYLHFGDGMHRCFGEYLNRVLIPVIVGALCQLPDLRPAGPILWDGPFPDQFILKFTPSPSAAQLSS